MVHRTRDSNTHGTEQDAIGKHQKLFAKNMKWLKKKWKGATDSEEYRLMYPLITGETALINLAVIADNLEYFKDHYREIYGEDPTKPLDRACLCGSRHIADFLLKELKLNYTSDNCDFVLTYASASMNQDWIKEIATKMARANKPVPELIYALADDATIDMIVDIFETTQKHRSDKVHGTKAGPISPVL